MTTYGYFLKTYLLSSFEIVLGNINSLFEQTILSVKNRNSRPVIFYRNENQKDIPFTQAYNRIYQQMETYILTGAHTNTSLLNTVNSLGSTLRLANYDRVGSRYKVDVSGDMITNAGGGQVSFRFVLDTDVIVDTGTISIPNLSGTGHWGISIEFVVIQVGGPGTAIIKSNGYFRLANKQAVDKLYPMDGLNSTTFQTTNQSSTDIQITNNAIVSQVVVSDLVYYYLN